MLAIGIKMHNFKRAKQPALLAMCSAIARGSIEIGKERRATDSGISVSVDQLAFSFEGSDLTAASCGLVADSCQHHAWVKHSEMEGLAAKHGLELLQMGHSVNEVVHQYGDLREAIIELAYNGSSRFQLEELRVLNQSVDNGIADAVAEFSAQNAVQLAERRAAATNEKLGFIMHELRNALGIAMLAMDAIEVKGAPLTGRTGAVLKRSHASMKRLISDTLIEAKISATHPHELNVFSLSEFIADAEDEAQLESQSRNCSISVSPVEHNLYARGDRELLLAALGNIVHNAFKFTARGTGVSLKAYGFGDRLFIDVADQCGGIPVSDVESIFTPFKQYGADRSGAGLGLTIARHTVAASGGTLTVVNKPGTGCVFRIALPSHSA